MSLGLGSLLALVNIAGQFVQNVFFVVVNVASKFVQYIFVVVSSFFSSGCVEVHLLLILVVLVVVLHAFFPLVVSVLDGVFVGIFVELSARPKGIPLVVHEGLCVDLPRRLLHLNLGRVVCDAHELIVTPVVHFVEDLSGATEQIVQVGWVLEEFLGAVEDGGGRAHSEDQHAEVEHVLALRQRAHRQERVQDVVLRTDNRLGSEKGGRWVLTESMK